MKPRPSKTQRQTPRSMALSTWHRGRHRNVDAVAPPYTPDQSVPTFSRGSLSVALITLTQPDTSPLAVSWNHLAAAGAAVTKDDDAKKIDEKKTKQGTPSTNKTKDEKQADDSSCYFSMENSVLSRTTSPPPHYMYSSNSEEDEEDTACFLSVTSPSVEPDK